MAFAFVVVAETGRQPVDNPDTHLELTMIHEGPLLEYAAATWRSCSGRLQHATGSCCRSQPQIFLPHASRPVVAARAAAVVLVALCAALALVETVFAKMRVLLVPRMLGIAAGVALLGIAASLCGAA